MTWSPDLLILVTLTFLLAGTVKGVIGMALPTVSLGVLAVTIGLKEAIVLMLVPSFVTNVWQGVIGGNFTMLIKRLWGLLAAMLLGTWFGAEALTMTDTSILEALLGVTLIGYGIFGLLTPELPTMKRRERWLSPIVGGATGILAGLTGSTVLPVVPYLQSLDYAKGRPGREDDDTDLTRATDETMQKDALIQGLGVTVLVASIALAIGLNARGGLPVSVVVPGLIGTATALIGMVTGRAIRNRMSLEIFRRGVLIGLVGLGLAMIARSVG